MRACSAFFSLLCVLVPSGAFAAEPDSSAVKVTVVLAGSADTFAGCKLEVRLWEIDPRLADRAAREFDAAIVDFSHEKGKETTRELTVGQVANGGKIVAGRSYYLTVYVTDGGKRTHMGEMGAPGPIYVLTAGRPREVRATLRQLN